MSIILEHKTHEKIYNPCRNPQRRNPTYCQKISPILCKYCKENVKGVKGRNSYYRTLNQIWAHFSYDHYNIDFKPYLMDLADQVIEGELS